MTRLCSFIILSVIILECLAGSAPWTIETHLATKTMYSSEEPSSQYTPPPASCSLVQINHLARHGARYPGSSTIKKMSQLQTKIAQNANYLVPEFQWMANWTNPYNTKMSDILTYSGQIEHYNMAQRMIKQYGSIMTQPYKPFTYEMQSTTKSRTGQSGTSFGFSMQQSNGHLPPSWTVSKGFAPFFIYSESAEADRLLRFFDNCPNYDTQVVNNASASLQSVLYEPKVAQQATVVAKMIGVYPHWNLTASDLGLMYQLCGYEIAITNNTSQFCTIFNESIANVCEYEADLDAYYKKGYGYKINYEIACLLLNEFLDIHQEFINGTNTDLLAKFRFAHAETVMPFVSLLGLFKDATPLMADWTDEQIANRKWRTSDISPFAANVLTLLYDCGGSYSLKLMVNEEEQMVPGCSNMYCPFDEVLSIYASATECPFNEYCFPNASPCEYYCPNQ